MRFSFPVVVCALDDKGVEFPADQYPFIDLQSNVEDNFVNVKPLKVGRSRGEEFFEAFPCGAFFFFFFFFFALLRSGFVHTSNHHPHLNALNSFSPGARRKGRKERPLPRRAL